MVTLIETTSSPGSTSNPSKVIVIGVSIGVLAIIGVAAGSVFTLPTSITKLPAVEVALSSSVTVNAIFTKSAGVLV